MSTKLNAATKSVTSVKVQVEAAPTGLTPAEINFAKKILERALRPRALPVYSAEERLALAFRVADLQLRQAALGKKGRASDVVRTKYRKDIVNILLHHVVDRRYREDPRSGPTVMVIRQWLYDLEKGTNTKIGRSESQVRRAIGAALESGPFD